MKKLAFLLSFVAACMIAAPAKAAQQSGSFRVGDKTFLLNDKPFVVKAAEVHYPRIPREYWEQRIQMCKALGMNTLCIYIFWNSHEQQEGKFDFTGNNDIRAFVNLAQKNGMYVIVRPGPYVCAEWEMGGLPWWLLKKKDIRLREQDPYFMERLEIFEKKVGEQLGDLTIEKGGPIIMVQVENEYGSYGEDKPYISAVRDIIRKSGFDKVELFQCDWSSNFTKNGLDDLTWTMNFGTGANIDNEFKKLGELRPNSPKMCSEFWSGWFDKWGGRHETRGAEAMVDGISQMLDRGISFSLYMTHGGTNWGHWAGANSPGFAPDVTSYDYDAPINEAGQTTDKFWKLRKAMEKYSGDWDPVAQKWVGNKKLPAVPKEYPTIAIPKFELTEFHNILCGVQKSTDTREVKTIEELDMGWGSAVYRTRLPEVKSPSTLTINDLHDFGLVYVDGKLIGTVNRIKNEKSLQLPAVKEGAQLTILVEAMGRINFGRAIKDFKGITRNVELKAEVGGHELTYDLKNWNIELIPDDYATATKALAIQKKIDELQPQVSNNTGKPNATKLEAFAQQVAEARTVLVGSPDETTQQQTIDRLHAAYQTLQQTGFNPAGTPDEVGMVDITLEYLLEKKNFSATEMGSRFGKPVHWTVENFSIPQNDTSKGTKNGIDNYPGTNTLMMGKWGSEDGKPATNMTNARIYRSIHLKPGQYYFGATFNALYQLGTAFIYVASEPLNTTSINKQAIAKLAMSKCATDGKFYGVTFTLTEEQDVVLAFQANMQAGNADQEFRVVEVKLQYCPNPDNLTQTDITKEQLIQASRFSRVSGQSTTTRYGAPRNWNVENYNIPAGSDGTRHGLDRYPGYDCLTLGVWGDKNNNNEGDLADARVYRKVHLGHGSYYFGAAYEANYQLFEAYIFAATETMHTSEIPQKALAYDRIADAGISTTTFRGVYFELPEEQDVILGFQANLKDGSGEQEFRASSVVLVRYGKEDGIGEMENERVKSEKWVDTVFDLNGRKVSKDARGIKIVNGRIVF